MSGSQLLVCETRGGLTDNAHLGTAVVADVDGKAVFCAGEAGKRAFLRSAGKPLQALAFVEAGGVEAYGLTKAELAIICASHRGGKLQVETVRSILNKVGLKESDLRAGSGIQDNCSGKHSGMLAFAKLLGHPTEGYWERQHPIQKVIVETVSAMCGLAANEMGVAVDGCGAPIFEMPVLNMAVGYARLANPDGLGPKRVEAARKILDAMQEHPEMVGGVDLRPFCGRKLVAKSGASGVYCAGAVGQNLGFAVKLHDGSAIGLTHVLFVVLGKLGVLTGAEVERFKAQTPALVKNRRGDVVGEVVVSGI